jgi:hypothetical protein
MYRRLIRIDHHELGVDFDHQVVDQTNDDEQQYWIDDHSQVLVRDCCKSVLCSIE